MKLRDFTSDFRLMLDHSSELLGGEARPVQIEWTIEHSLERHLIRRGSSGIGMNQPLVWLNDGRRGHEITIGVQLYGLRLPDAELPIVEISPPYRSRVPQFWAVREQDYRRFYRFIREKLKESRAECVEPIMCASDRQRLWDNTVGFLRRDVSQLKRFGVPQKRGVLLSGDPGNGKTMACRWLRSQCERVGLDWTNVTADEYESARRDQRLHDLFQPDRAGVVLFDDFDAALRDREKCDNPREQSTFLTEIDGMAPKIGVVYLFTSNLKSEELDPALRRPGRIDDIIHFAKPDADRRKELIHQRWHIDIVQGIPVDDVVRQTEGFSFAEMEELKKQLVLGYLDSGQIDWPIAQKALDQRRELVETRRSIGFSTGRAASTDSNNSVSASDRDQSIS
ncbi:MAG: ATP-binding protein [Planctomycetes bacterium]|nr:ATP-binding protein [Planctomycetota bacterium]